MSLAINPLNGATLSLLNAAKIIHIFERHLPISPKNAYLPCLKNPNWMIRNERKSKKPAPPDLLVFKNWKFVARKKKLIRRGETSGIKLFCWLEVINAKIWLHYALKIIPVGFNYT
jgi:hypothetical protein